VATDLLQLFSILEHRVDQRGRGRERRAAAHRCCCGVVSFAVSTAEELLEIATHTATQVVSRA
jgi:hypothetical protein